MTPFSASPNGVGARRAWLSFGDVGFSGLVVSGSFSGLLVFLAWLWCGCLFFLVLSAWSVFLCFPLSRFRWVWFFRFCWFRHGLVPGSGRKGHPGCMVSARIISGPGPRVLTLAKDRRPADIGSGAGIGSPVWPGPVRKAHERIGKQWQLPAVKCSIGRSIIDTDRTLTLGGRQWAEDWEHRNGNCWNAHDGRALRRCCRTIWTHSHPRRPASEEPHADSRTRG